MTSIKFLGLLVLAAGLAACTKPVEVVNPPPVVVTVPGPTGATGATGETGATGVTGKPGDSTTVIVVPAPTASAATN